MGGIMFLLLKNYMPYHGSDPDRFVALTMDVDWQFTFVEQTRQKFHFPYSTYGF